MSSSWINLKSPRGGGIGDNANQCTNLKVMMQRSPETRLEAEYPVKGSELLPRDSSR